MITLETAIDRILQVGHEAGHCYERLPWDLVCELARGFGADEEGVGLLMLCVGVANWGAVDPYSSRTSSVPYGLAHDPAHDDWRGRPAGSGKHLTDYRRGGLGLPHWDGGHLEYWWRYGDASTLLRPPDRVMAQSWDFNKLNDDPAWIDWFRRLTESRDWQHASMRRWLAHYWVPSWRVARDGPGTWLHRVRRAAVNCRIRNSVPALAKEVEQLSADAQAEKYVAYKLEQRGEKAAERARRQIRYAERVPVLVEAARSEEV